MAKEATIVSIIEIDKYNNWMVQEYNGKYSVVDAWKTKDDEWRASFCKIERKGNEYKIPKGLGGSFEDLQELRSALFRLIKSIDEYDEGTPNVPSDTPQEDIPF